MTSILDLPQRAVALTALTLLLAAASAGVAFADETGRAVPPTIGGAPVGAAVPMAPAEPVAPMVQTSPSGVSYVNGGVAAEQRVAMQSLQSSFPLRLVFSRPDGAYAVVDHLAVEGSGGRLLDVDQAGPVLLVSLQPGSYRVTADVQGRHVTKDVKVGSTPRTVNWKVDES